MRFSVTCGYLIITMFEYDWSLNPYKAELGRSDNHIMGLRSCFSDWRDIVLKCFCYAISYMKANAHGIDAIRGFSHVVSFRLGFSHAIDS